MMTLQNEYQRVDYIESTGTQWIDMNYIPNENTLWECDVMFVNRNNIDYTAFGMLYRIENTYSRFHFGLNNKNSISIAVGKTDIIASGVGGFDKFKIVLNTNGDVQIDNRQYRLEALDVNHVMSLHIFRRNSNMDGLTVMCEARLYGSRIYEGDKLIKDFVPCYRKFDGEIGLLDIVNNVFYENCGTGKFLKGEDV